MSDWYYVHNGQRQGPIATEALRELIASGKVGAADPVWSAPMGSWMAAGQVTELWPAGVSQPPPLPQAPLPIAYAGPAPYGYARPLGEDAGMRMLLPVGRSGWAIAAGYLGLFSVLLVPAPLAILCAILAFREMKRNPAKHGMGRAIFGLLMGILGTLGLVFMVISHGVVR